MTYINQGNMMNVYQKLQDARLELQSNEMKKSGHNKFAGYYYFELGDFLQPIQQLFKKHGLFGAVSFQPDIATLTVTNMDDPKEQIVFTSPMGSAALKGCHEVQNIGAVETYQRRYLWVTALEIVEHDALEATTGKDDPDQKQQSKPRQQEQNKQEGQGPEPDAMIVAQFNGAKDIPSLTKVMNGLPAAERGMYTGIFNGRMAELKKG